MNSHRRAGGPGGCLTNANNAHNRERTGAWPDGAFTRSEKKVVADPAPSRHWNYCRYAPQGWTVRSAWTAKPTLALVVSQEDNRIGFENSDA
jgi:hypothetical protein